MSSTLSLPPCLRLRYLLRIQSCSYATSSKPTAAPQTPKPKPPKFPLESLSYHWETLPPTPAQLSHASTFFEKSPKAFTNSAAKFKTISFAQSPEVCFVGRSNVGKSSLLNALLGAKLAHSSAKPGRTKLMNAFAIGSPGDNGEGDVRLTIMDMPGYGKGARAEWGKEILKYMEKRESLKRVFLLIDAKHGIKSTDEQLLALFKEYAIPFQVVVSKVDRLFREDRKGYLIWDEERGEELKRMMEGVKEAIQPESEEDGGALGEIIACSSARKVEGKRLGIDAVRFAVLRAAGLEFKPKVQLAKPVEIVSHEEIFGLKEEG